MEKITKAQAEKEVTSWLDHKKYSPAKRVAKQENFDAIVSAICDGTLALNDDFTFTHKLGTPIEDEHGNVAYEKLTYKARLKATTIQLGMEKVNAQNFVAIYIAYISILTSLPKALIGMLDSEDYILAQSIAAFFL